MSERPSPAVFDTQNAAAYDSRWAKLGPTRGALYLLIRVLLSDLPTDAHILCVGAGTGSELIHLGEAFPHWHFTAVDPAPAMLALCRQRTEAAGIAGRCTFHEGTLDTLDTLPPSPPFNAATSLLVSHFIPDKTARSDYFYQIARRLRPGSLCISADLSGDLEAPMDKTLLDAWRQMLKYIEIPEAEIERVLGTFGNDVAVLPPNDVAEIIMSGGFDAPTLFFQSLLLRAWFARRTA